MGPRGRLIYRLSRWAVGRWLRSAVDLEVLGREHIPAAGAAIVIGNHPSALDAFLYLDVLERPINAFVRAENVRLPMVGWYLRGLGAIPVVAGRPNATAALAARRVLRAGGLLVILPEGDANPGQRVGPFASGFVPLAALLGVPVVPCAIVGSDRAVVEPRRPSRPWHWWLRRARVRVQFLPPTRLDDAELDRPAMARAAEQLRARVQAAVDRLASCPPAAG